MQIEQGDILTKTSKGKTIYWLSERLVVSTSCLSCEYLKIARVRYKKSVEKRYRSKTFLPDTGKSWRFAKTGKGFYYCLDNLPDRSPNYYRSQFGTKDQIKEALNALESRKQDDLNSVLKATIEAQVTRGINNQDISYYMFDAPTIFNQKKADALAEGLAWLRFTKLSYESQSFKNFGVKNKQHFIELTTEILADKGLEGLKVSSSAYLRNKLRAFPAGSILEQRNYLISDKYNNQNALIVGKFKLVNTDTGEVYDFDLHQAVIYNSFMNPGKTQKKSRRKLYVEDYKPTIESFGTLPVSYEAFKSHVDRFNLAVAMEKERHGANYYKNSRLTYVPSEKLKYAHSLICADGSGTISYKYHYKTKAKDEMRHMKLYVMLVTDVASRKIIGYSFSSEGQHKESHDMVAEAMKLAVETCGKQTMFEFISDNHGAFTGKESKNLLNLIFNKVRTIEKGNSQANPAEAEFRMLKQQLKSLPNFTTSSWESGLEGKSNEDYLDFESLPTYREAILQFIDEINKWNSSEMRDGTTPNQRFENKHPDLMPMRSQVLTKLYGKETQVDVSRMRGFVQVYRSKGYDSEAFLFEIPNFETTGVEQIAKACNYARKAKVKVYWTEEVADLYTLEDEFIMSCKRAVKSSQSHAERSEEQLTALGHHLNRKTAQITAADAFRDKVVGVFEFLDDEEEEITIEDLPYEHSIALGGNKESYNETQKQNDRVLTRAERAKRDFDEMKLREVN